jgi:hypothetical protein
MEDEKIALGVMCAPASAILYLEVAKESEKK